MSERRARRTRPGALYPASDDVPKTIDGLGWRSAFLVHLVIGIPALLVARRVLVETERHHKSSLPDMVGSLLVAVVQL